MALHYDALRFSRWSWLADRVSSHWYQGWDLWKFYSVKLYQKATTKCEKKGYYSLSLRFRHICDLHRSCSCPCSCLQAFNSWHLLDQGQKLCSGSWRQFFLTDQDTLTWLSEPACWDRYITDSQRRASGPSVRHGLPRILWTEQWSDCQVPSGVTLEWDSSAPACRLLWSHVWLANELVPHPSQPSRVLSSHCLSQWVDYQKLAFLAPFGHSGILWMWVGRRDYLAIRLPY